MVFFNASIDYGDANITLYSYDYRNRLIDIVMGSVYGGSVTKEFKFSYDYQNRKISESYDADGAGSGTFTYDYLVWQGDNPIIQVYDRDGLGGTTYSPSVTHRYLQESKGTVIADMQSGYPFWFITDMQGTVRDVAYYDQSSNSWLITHRCYDSYGVLESTWHAGTTYIEPIFGYQGMMSSIYDMKLLAAGATQLYVDKYFTINRVYDPS